MSFLYQAFGLCIASEIEIPEFIPGEGTPDVWIRRGAVPAKIPGIAFRYWLLNGQQVLFKHDDFRALICDGQSITLDFKPEGEGSMRAFLLGSLTGMLLMQRGHFLLHASVVHLEGQTVAFSGPSGIGKSTTALALCQQGGEMLTEDLCALNEKGEVLPAMPRLKLKEDSRKALNCTGEWRDIPFFAGKHTQAHGVPFLCQAKKVDKLFFIIPENEAFFETRPMPGFESASRLHRNTYRLKLSEVYYGIQKFFQACTVMSQQIPTFALQRPTDIETPGWQEKLKNAVLEA